jgi:hypothetical protein
MFATLLDGWSGSGIYAETATECIDTLRKTNASLIGGVTATGVIATVGEVCSGA